MIRPEEPHCIESEKSILGAVLVKEACFLQIVDGLQRDDLYEDAHRRIFDAMYALYTTGNPIDMVSLTGELKQSADFERVGGTSYLGELMDFFPSTSNVGFYLKKVLVKSRQRQLMSAGRQIQIDAGKIDADPDQLIADAFGHIQSINQTAEVVLRRGATDLQPEYIESVKGFDAESCFNFAAPAVNAIIPRIAPGEVAVVLGGPGCFKSAFQQNVLHSYTIKTGRKALMISLEMPAPLVYQRMVQILLEQVTFFIESGHAGKKGEEYLQRTREELLRLGADRLLVCTKPDLTLEQIEHYTRMAQAEHGDIGVLGIDYLGLVRVDGVTSEYEQMSKIGKSLKGLAKRLNLPVFALSQINRASAVGGEITQHSAKGSGDINAGADVVLGLYKNENKDVILKVLKSRSGEDGVEFKADLDAKFLKFRDFHPYNPVTQKIVDGKRSRLRTKDREAGSINVDPF